ncbi:unnamed protein product [Gordionus sp. m RMFG-2023]
MDIRKYFLKNVNEKDHCKKINSNPSENRVLQISNNHKNISKEKEIRINLKRIDEVMVLENNNSIKLGGLDSNAETLVITLEKNDPSYDSDSPNKAINAKDRDSIIQIIDQGTIGKVYDMFKYPKRSNVLKNCLAKEEFGNSHHKLVKICPTRWILHNLLFIILGAVLDGYICTTLLKVNKHFYYSLYIIK